MKRTYHPDETVSMERMLTREDIELSGKQRIQARRAPLVCANRDESVLQVRNIFLDRLGTLGRFVHLRLEFFDMSRVSLQCCAYFFLEVVDDYKVGEEREDILDLEKVCTFEEAHCPVGTSC